MGFDGFFKPHGIRDYNFFFGTQEAVDWYLPLKPYTKLEYEWVLENIPLCRQRVIDAGSHHGNYAIIFGDCAHLVCVDPFMHNIQLTEHNLLINSMTAELVWGAVAKERGARMFEYRPNGRLSERGTVEVETYKMVDIDPLANIIKLDVEGAEFEILPGAISEMQHCHTWIIEVHPQYGNPDDIAKAFSEWDLLWVNRDTLEVEPYNIGTRWKTQATVIARNK